MKIVNSINSCYKEQEKKNKELKEYIDRLFIEIKPTRWHYEGRIKQLESYALKIESGRVEKPTELDDFFACTVVVENSIEIKKAVEFLEKYVVVMSKKPSSEKFTHKRPEAFPYDDLRLYVTLKPDESLPPESETNRLSKVLFELQIKTFLQHAWSIATHDLIYKGQEIDWAKERVSFQIKAMLEHAELSIHELERIKDSDTLPKLNKEVKELCEIDGFVKKNWSRDQLPNETVRLCKNIHKTIKCFEITITELQGLLDLETNEKRGTNTLNLSPFFAILQTIINQKPEKVQQYLDSSIDSSIMPKIVIPNELDSSKIRLNSKKVISI